MEIAAALRLEYPLRLSASYTLGRLIDLCRPGIASPPIRSVRPSAVDMTVTREQRAQITDIVLTELRQLVDAALAAGVRPAEVTKAVARRRRAIEAAR